MTPTLRRAVPEDAAAGAALHRAEADCGRELYDGLGTWEIRMVRA